VTRILIIGGYGAFGAHAARRLARSPGLDIVVAGRSAEKAAAFAAGLERAPGASVGHAMLDAMSVRAEDIAALRPSVVINASGPFQHQADYRLARAAIAARCHYIDLADARGFVTGITGLDADAKRAGVAAISGASSVPGLSSAVVQAYASRFEKLDTVEIGISPGNSFDPGVATVASILGHAGKPHAELREGVTTTVYGWQGLHRHHFPAIGARLMGSVDVPDLALLPQHYPELTSVRFSAGLEVGPFHLGVWGLSWLVRAHLLRSLEPLAGAMLGMKRALHFLGTDTGGMFVTLCGRDADGARKQLRWHLIARSGDGPYVPAIPAVILARKLAAGTGPAPGAGPCFALFSLADFAAEVADLDIVCGTDWNGP
jgi:saccharopine dehydrogenase-like NADP-dependent oxidoreductase